jgi:hypothetical protein
MGEDDHGGEPPRPATPGPRHRERVLVAALLARSAPTCPLIAAGFERILLCTIRAWSAGAPPLPARFSKEKNHASSHVREGLTRL